jgi:hypothetical protein
MAFGQPAGPPAPANQLRELLTLLQEAGHSDFRDARGPMGFTQRQAAGKFTRDEVAAFIDRLQAVPTDPAPPAAPPTPTRAAPARPGPAPSVATSPVAPSPVLERALRGMASEPLAAELRRRGWLVLEP